MTHTDPFGLPFTTGSTEAAGHFGAALQSYADYRLDVGDLIKAALQADPEFCFANTVRGYLMMLFGNSAFLPVAAKALAAAEAHQEGITERERLHIAALRAWVAGDQAGACREWEALLVASPQDLLALKLVTFTYFWLGDRRNMRDAVTRVLPRWKADMPGYGYVLGMLSFGHEECGEYGEAEKAGRRAVEIHPGDHWATHAVAHIMEMQGRRKEGVAWLDGLSRHWGGCNNFVIHLWWHKALFHLELEQYDQVFALYDGEIRKEPSDFYLDMQNAISLLWRLNLRGLEVGPRWAELAEKSAERIDDLALPFTDLHFVMALLADGRNGEAQRIVEAMRAYGANHSTTFAPVIDEVALPVAEGLVAFAAGNYQEAGAKLLGVREQLYRTGGSHAQRDVFIQTMIEAHLRGGDFAKAAELLAERTGGEAVSAQGWREYAQALAGGGRNAEAEAARANVQSLLA